jgi:hypothetical protein
MKPRSTFPWIAAGLAACVLYLGAAAVRQALAPVDWARSFLNNPFGLNARAVPSGAVILDQVQRLRRLETCRYNGQVVVRGENAGPLPVWLAGDRLMFVGQGEVVAGVDLARLRPGDVEVRGRSLTLHLPRPEVFYASLDNRRSEVCDRQSGLLTGPDRTLETRVRVVAEDRIRQAALEHGVLATAGENARDELRRQLVLLGFREVRFVERADT